MKLLDRGGLALKYASPRGRDRDLEEAIRAMAERHNERRVDIETPTAAGDLLAKPVRSIAVVETTSNGPRLVLMPADPDSLPELYVNVALHAPDVVPRPASPETDCNADAGTRDSP